MKIGFGVLATAICITVLTSFVLMQIGCADATEAKPAASADAAATPADPAGPFAVIELFTSEGCSSCPPADKVLGDVLAESRRDGTRVFPLAFHVDYWDDLGWRDPFSDAAHSARQRAYGRSFKIDSVYTPQAIVNGTTQFVGSNADRAKRAIAEALAAPARTSISLSVAAATEPDALAITFAVRPLSAAATGPAAPPAATLNIAVVERDLATEVARGENGGRSLRHQNVVRAFRAIQLDPAAKGQVTLNVPRSVRRGSASIIAYAQEATNSAVLGATQVDPVPPAPKAP